ncbi:hypothetical protein [Plasticicumulans sp.]|uniref:hypothetical protein n=1 Tax=Plasticicumulans sp. TaxID=2307179 RepID=UPI002CA8DB9D|nr:hypothetical protein [Plasticicumulans sp.]HMW31007.1 hypothetical protein [Plasticicumulans sp.]
MTSNHGNTATPATADSLAAARLRIELIREVLAMTPEEIRRACWRLGVTSTSATAAPWRGRPSLRVAYLRRRQALRAAA